MKKTEWTMETLDNRSAFMRNIASNTTIKHKNSITEEVLDEIRAEIEEHAKINQHLNTDRARTLCWCLDVIDKYKEEGEAKE